MDRPLILGIPVEIAFAMFALLAGINIIFLDIVVARELRNPIEPAAVTVTSESPASPARLAESERAGGSALPETSCPAACLSLIASQPSTPSAQQPVQSSLQPTASSVSSVKEFFVPFGSSSGSATDWTEVVGLEATVDAANYSRIKTVVFEATLRIPTGNQVAWARLFNATDKHPVWFSDVAVEGGTAKLVASPPITLDPGNKTYQVQLKTSLGSQTFIDQARLHILTY